MTERSVFRKARRFVPTTETRAEANKFDGKAYFTSRFDGDENGRFLVLWGGDVRNKIVGIGSSDLHTGKDSLDLVDIDGVPTSVMRCTDRYEKSVKETADVNSAYSFIAHRFAECDIRWLFPELWTAWKNARAKKARRRTEHDYLEARKQGRLKYLTTDARTIRGITNGCDVRQAARHYGAM